MAVVGFCRIKHFISPYRTCRASSRGIILSLMIFVIIVFFLSHHYNRREQFTLSSSSPLLDSEFGKRISQRFQRLFYNDDIMRNATSINRTRELYHDSSSRKNTESIHSNRVTIRDNRSTKESEKNVISGFIFRKQENKTHTFDSSDRTENVVISSGKEEPNLLLNTSSTMKPALYHFTPQHMSHSQQISRCNIKPRSWTRGVLTELSPRIEVNCDLLKQDNRPEVERVKREMKSWKSSQSEEQWRNSFSNCSRVIEEFSDNFYNSPGEVEFPIAYILVVYTNPQQMVRLIKALWRPQNIFCVHPDAKQSQEFINIFRQISKCLDNVFLPRKLERVYYQHHTIMDSQMNCYEDLMRYEPSRWKYVINLCGRELPLKTNREIVDYLKKLKGHSAIETQHINTDSRGYTALDRFKWKAKEDYKAGKLRYTNERLKKAPIPIYKSTNFIAATRPFVNFFLTNQKAVEFRNYLKDVKIPEEEFYASLIHLPGVPGGLPPHKIPLPTIDRYVWMNKYKKTRSKWETCEGRMVHFICILGAGDLDQVYRSGVNRRPPVFFFNKYFMEEDHVVMDCMEERLIRQNMKEHENDCLHKHL